MTDTVYIIFSHVLYLYMCIGMSCILLNIHPSENVGYQIWHLLRTRQDSGLC